LFQGTTGDNSFFGIYEFEQGTRIKQHADVITVAFLLRGRAEFALPDGQFLDVRKNHFFIIPAGIDYDFHFFWDSVVLLYYVHNAAELSQLIRERIFSHEEEIPDKRCITLRRIKFIRRELKNFIEAVEAGLKQTPCIFKISEIVISYILAFYPVEELRRFFGPTLFGNRHYWQSIDANFEITILENRNKIFKVKKFASLTNHGQESFRLHFKRIFGVSPRQWIIKERCKLVREELVFGEKSFQAISAIAGFNTELECYRFVKKQFGKTATEIRKHG